MDEQPFEDLSAEEKYHFTLNELNERLSSIDNLTERKDAPQPQLKPRWDTSRPLKDQNLYKQTAEWQKAHAFETAKYKAENIYKENRDLGNHLFVEIDKKEHPDKSMVDRRKEAKPFSKSIDLVNQIHNSVDRSPSHSSHKDFQPDQDLD